MPLLRKQRLALLDTLCLARALPGVSLCPTIIHILNRDYS